MYFFNSRIYIWFIFIASSSPHILDFVFYPLNRAACLSGTCSNWESVFVSADLGLGFLARFHLGHAVLYLDILTYMSITIFYNYFRNNARPSMSSSREDLGFASAGRQGSPSKLGSSDPSFGD